MHIQRSLIIGAVGVAVAASVATIGGAAAADLINGRLLEPQSVTFGKLTPGAVDRLQGQTGPQGPPGPTGGVKLTGDSGTSYVCNGAAGPGPTVDHHFAQGDVGRGALLDASVSCPDGTVATGGGGYGRDDDAGTYSLPVSYSQPIVTGGYPAAGR